MISIVKWLPLGAARAIPERYEVSPEELQQMHLEEKHESVQDSDSEMEDVAEAATSMETLSIKDQSQEDFLSSLKMDEYDDEDDTLTVLSGAKTVHESNADDPYITVPDDEDNSSDDEDVVIKPTDQICIAGKTNEARDSSKIEVHIFDTEGLTTWIHHDFEIPSFPLAVAWMDLDPRDRGQKEKGSFLAIGTFNPEIEIWNLDILDLIEPVTTLGGRHPPDPAYARKMLKKSKKKKVTRKKKEKALLGKLKKGSHSNAVMCLSWHPAHRNRLASGSADNTIKLWNVTTQQCTQTLTHHSNKIQSIDWNPAEPSIILSGAYDRRVAVLDTRDPNPENIKYYQMDSDVEQVCWNPHNPACFVACTENGTVVSYDVRKSDRQPLYNFQAHTKATCGVVFNTGAPNFLATASLDKTVKLWDTTDDKPTCFVQKKMHIGEIFSIDFTSKDFPFLLATGGNEDQRHLGVWDVLGNSTVREKYKDHIHIDVEPYLNVEPDDEYLPGQLPESDNSDSDSDD